MEPLSLIGVGGYARSGKDTTAKYFIERFGFTRVGFSDELKFEVAQKLRKTLAVEAKRFYGHQLSGGLATLDEVIHKLLWEDRTELTRALLQEWGTSVRRAEDPDYWTSRLIKKYLNRHGQRFVVPDTRFLNELQLIRTWNGFLIWIERPGIGPESSHPSETTLGPKVGWDAIIVNDGTKQDLYAKLDMVVEKHELFERLPRRV